MGICVSCRRRERKAPEKRLGAGLGAGGPGKGPAAAELLPRRVGHLPAMANSISNIKMTNPIKGMVSRRRKRYIKDGFNLDLAYITDRLIAMGFPAEKLEGVYRNHIDEVYRFLEQMHKDHYKIYNLCSERSYDSSKFHERVERYAFDDHTPPNMELIQPFCEDVHSWLSADPRNVAAVHCKAGKGRTGTMVCCYLLYSGQKATADEALKFYGTKRTYDEKGVTIPSQRRYVEYYAELVRSGLQYKATKVYIRELIMSPPPQLNGGQCTLELTVSQAQPPFKVTVEAPHGCHEVRKSARSVRVVLTHCTPLHGDVRLDVYNKPKMMMRKEKLFHFWFNTFFLVSEFGALRIPAPADSPNQETYKLTLNKWQLDDAHKDKQHKLYSPDFKVELIVQKQPESSTFSAHAPRPHTPASDSSPSDARSDTEPDLDLDPDADNDEHWDSGTSAVPLARPSRSHKSGALWNTTPVLLVQASRSHQGQALWDSTSPVPLTQPSRSHNKVGALWDSNTSPVPLTQPSRSQSDVDALWDSTSTVPLTQPSRSHRLPRNMSTDSIATVAPANVRTQRAKETTDTLLPGYETACNTESSDNLHYDMSDVKYNAADHPVTKYSKFAVLHEKTTNSQLREYLPDSEFNLSRDNSANLLLGDYNSLEPSTDNTVKSYSKLPELDPGYILLAEENIKSHNLLPDHFDSPYELLRNEDSTKYKLSDDDEKMCLVDAQPVCRIHPNVPYEVLTNNDRSGYDTGPTLNPLYNLGKVDNPVPGNGHSKLPFKLIPDSDVPAYPDFPAACPEVQPDDPPAYKLLPDRNRPETRQFSKPRLSLTDVRASWREFSGKFSEHRKKRDKD